jgi:AsmA protein
MIKGTGTVVANINGVGLQPEGIKKTLNGKVNLQFKDGAVKGINVAQVIRKARATHSGGSAPTDEPNETDFAELTGTANIKNGLVSNNDLSLKSPLLRVSGEGTADLPSEQLDYLVNASIVESSRGQGGQDLADLRGVTIPVRISGSFADPSISPDLTAVLEERAKEEVQKHLDKEKGKVQEKLGDELGNRLKGLIK